MAKNLDDKKLLTTVKKHSQSQNVEVLKFKNSKKLIKKSFITYKWDILHMIY